MGGACSSDGKGRGYIGFWWGNLRKRDHWGDPGVDERIILRWIFKKWNVGGWTGFSWLRIQTGHSSPYPHIPLVNAVISFRFS
jgi:hypothetical protein